MMPVHCTVSVLAKQTVLVVWVISGVDNRNFNLPRALGGLIALVIMIDGA